MIYVIEGRLQITLEEGARTVGTGDFAIYSSAQPYAYVAMDGAATRFIRNVVT
jgi:quercetin dioxygenase-like cupin family protein